MFKVEHARVLDSLNHKKSFFGNPKIINKTQILAGKIKKFSAIRILHFLRYSMLIINGVHFFDSVQIPDFHHDETSFPIIPI